MNAYGCWDCGCEVRPFQGRCAVCGWPAPSAAPRKKSEARVIMWEVVLGVLAIGLLWVFASVVPRMGTPRRVVVNRVEPQRVHSLDWHHQGCGKVFDGHVLRTERRER